MPCNLRLQDEKGSATQNPGNAILGPGMGDIKAVRRKPVWHGRVAGAWWVWDGEEVGRARSQMDSKPR